MSDAPKRGRPTEYTREIADEVCLRMIEGESLRSICKEERFPSEGAVRMWAVNDRDGFAARYARAREAQMDAHAEDIVEISDAKDEDSNRARLRVDTRKWLMAKIAPKKYGDRTRHEHTGANGGAINVAAIDPAKLAGLSAEELAVLERAYLTLGISAGDPSGAGEASGAEDA
ncbi:hypothetical protein OIU35_31665 [Boseaceae bacterium BT-24-1]|nr:hypothetical protein [Boseaceae bacterium BT-24-1]